MSQSQRIKYFNQSSKINGLIQPGELLNDGRYRVERFLDAGGMAHVYAATDLLYNRPVAIKILKTEKAVDLDMMRRFNREYDMIANFEHPNIVNVYGRFNERGTKCIVLELIRGETLKNQIITFGNVITFSIYQIINQVCAGLIKIHQQGIIHRDIKPENILIANHGVIKITDFGIAIHYQPPPLKSNEKPIIIGTTKYMAPEVVQRQPIDYTVDVYALGILLYECLISYPPFSRFNSE